GPRPAAGRRTRGRDCCGRCSPGSARSAGCRSGSARPRPAAAPRHRRVLEAASGGPTGRGLVPGRRWRLRPGCKALSPQRLATWRFTLLSTKHEASGATVYTEHFLVKRNQGRRPMVVQQTTRLPEPELQVPIATVMVADVSEHGPDVIWDLKPTLLKLFIAHGAMDVHGIHLGGEPAPGKPLATRSCQQAISDGGDSPLIRHEEWEHQAV